MLKSPGLYGVGIDYSDDSDPGLIQKRADIIHSAAVILEKSQLLKYERSTGRFQSTELGRIASHYYVTYTSMQVYNQHLRPTMSMLELFRVFALSNEFKLIPVSVYGRLSHKNLLIINLSRRYVKRRKLNLRSYWNVFLSQSKKMWRTPPLRLMFYFRHISHNSS